MECSSTISDLTAISEGSEDVALNFDQLEDSNFTEKVPPCDLAANKCRAISLELENHTTILKRSCSAVEAGALPIDYTISKRPREDDPDYKTQNHRKKRKIEENLHFQVIPDYLKCFSSYNTLNNQNIKNQNVPLEESQSNEDQEIVFLLCKLNESKARNNKLTNYERLADKYNKYKKRIYQSYQTEIDDKNSEARLVEISIKIDSEPPELIPFYEMEQRQPSEPRHQDHNSTVSFLGYNHEKFYNCCQQTKNFDEDSAHICTSPHTSSNSSSYSPLQPHSLLHAHQMLMQKREKYLNALEEIKINSIRQQYFSNYYYLMNDATCKCGGNTELCQYTSSESSCSECQSSNNITNTINNESSSGVIN